MFTKKCKAIAAFAVCVVALVALGSGKNPVERPLKVHSVNVWTIDLASADHNTGIAPATLHAEGVATHTGRLTVDGAGLWDLSSTATPVGMYVSASGDATAANGEHLTWKLPGTAYMLEFTGGTGRFENVSGGFTPVKILDVAVTFPDAATMVVTIKAVGEGTITY
jgi:hypothetical protein